MRLAVLTVNLSPTYACLSTTESREFYSARLRFVYSTCTVSRRRTAPRSCSSPIFFLIVVLHALSRFTSHIRCSLRCHMTHALASSCRLAASLCSIRFHRYMELPLSCGLLHLDFKTSYLLYMNSAILSIHLNPKNDIVLYF